MNNNAQLRRYTWNAPETGLDTPLAVYDVATATSYFHRTDANKNVIALTNASGLKAWYEYSPFGVTLTATGAAAELNPFRFSSEYADSETELVYYNYRYYNPELGRWLSRDPIAESGRLNLYNFVANNPVNYWDELGMWKWYGKWGGPGWAAGLEVKDYWSLEHPEYNDVPFDNALDKCYKEHDFCYEDCRINHRCELESCYSRCDYLSVPCQIKAAAHWSNGVPWMGRVQGVIGAVALGGQGAGRDALRYASMAWNYTTKKAKDAWDIGTTAMTNAISYFF